jgi:hypothetical protein
MGDCIKQFVKLEDLRELNGEDRLRWGGESRKYILIKNYLGETQADFKKVKMRLMSWLESTLDEYFSSNTVSKRSDDPLGIWNLFGK